MVRRKLLKLWIFSILLGLTAVPGCSGVIGAPGGDFPQGENESGTPGGENGPGSVAPGVFAPAAPAMSRLTAQQYQNSVNDVFGAAIDSAVDLDPDEHSEEFSTIGAAGVATSESGVERYRDAALQLSQRAFEKRAQLEVWRDCEPSAGSDPCIRAFVEHYGLRLWRRPLTDGEVQRYLGLITSQGDEHLALGMSYTLASMMQSPNFLYLVRIGVDDAKRGLLRYSGYELASRLSYLIWNSMPDAELLAAASRGELDAVAGIQAQARRMLASPRARSLPTRFFGESWHVSSLTLLDKNQELFPSWTPSLLAAYKKEFDLVLQDLVFDRDTDIRQVFTSQTTFANAELAAFYGQALAGDDFVPLALDSTRIGLLTSGAVIAANSPSDRTSPTHRGLFIVERVFCEEIPPPPPNVDDVLQAKDEQGKPTDIRELLKQHRENPACASCHELFDPAGLTFENYDPIGTYRTELNGKPVDASGEFEGQTFNDVNALSQFIERDPRTSACIAKRFYAFAAGHDVAPGEIVVVDDLTEQLRSAGHRFTELVVAAVTSDGFRYLAAPQ